MHFQPVVFSLERTPGIILFLPLLSLPSLTLLGGRLESYLKVLNYLSPNLELCPRRIFPLVLRLGAHGCLSVA